MHLADEISQVFVSSIGYDWRVWEGCGEVFGRLQDWPMFVYDFLDGGVVFVEAGGEGYPVAGGFDFVDEELGSGGAGCFFFLDCCVTAGVTAFLEAFFQGGHSFFGVICVR